MAAAVLGLGVVALLSAADRVKASPPKDVPQATLDLFPRRPHAVASGETRCAACHGTSSWSDVRFAHDKTGFPLKGAHDKVDCRACHARDFTSRVPTTCSGCHRDPHQGDLGVRCEGCHDERSWASAFNADAHRRTAFPLVGAHSVMPCQECHAENRGQKFSRPTVACAACHQGNLERTRGTAVDHFRPGFSPDCQSCHGAFRFRPARFPDHDRCFVVSTGDHAGIACLKCHTTLNPSAATGGACNTRTAACTGCHEHQCAAAGGGQTETDRKHAEVAGYQCRDRKCYECHQAGLTP